MARITRRWWIAIIAAAVVLALAVVLLVNGSAAFGPAAGSSSPSTVSGSASPSASGSGSPTAAGDPTASQSATAGPPSSAAPSPAKQSAAQQVLAGMTLEQKVGQVLMVSSPVAGPDAATLAALTSYHVGNVFLKGRSQAGAGAAAAAVGQLNAQVSMQSTGGVAQFIATDQEGGQVQILNGPGFSPMPSALGQGAMDPGQLRADAQVWGSELAAAGVNVNLAPVLDTVPGPDFAPSNIPIGHYQREYGFTPEAVSSHGVAFALGMAAAGVAPAVKHFPGLGRVTENTDTSTGVADGATTRTDPYIAPFHDAVKAGVRWVMVANAIYPAIDPNHLAPFSPVIVRDMIRGDLGFDGIIISDDICDAVQLSPFLPAHRASNFIAAGGTMALCTNQKILPQLYQGMLDRASSDPVFAAQVDAAALTVLEAKAQVKLLGR
jgi:beta-N-acetylhexosaminidase